MSFIRHGALACLMLCAPFCFLTAQPKLMIVGGTTPDFGSVFTPSMERFITLKNVGTDTLTIANVSTSCGCTAALISNAHIAAGDSGILSIKFDAKRYAGPVQKTISMYTNDSTQKHIGIVFAVNVIKSLEVDPEYMFFYTTIDSTAESILSIKNSSTQTIRIRSVKPSSDFVSVKISNDKLDPGEEASLTGTIHPTETGTVRGNIEITTDFPIYPKLTVGYFAYTKRKKE
jgi:hypothetical protein